MPEHTNGLQDRQVQTLRKIGLAVVLIGNKRNDPPSLHHQLDTSYSDASVVACIPCTLSIMHQAHAEKDECGSCCFRFGVA
jgi:hypothetical protein